MTTFKEEHDHSKPVHRSSRIMVADEDEDFIKDAAPCVMAGSNREAIRPYCHVVAGATAGIITTVITGPLDVVKTRLQQHHFADPKHRPHGSGVTLREIMREEGIRGWYRGLVPTLLGILPTWAIYFPAYESYKSILAKKLGMTYQTTFVHVIAAIAAGGTCAVFTNPLWVVKTRMMTQCATSDYHYHSTMDAFRKILKAEGVYGMYKGLAPSLLGAVHVGIQFPLYEKLKVYFQECKGVSEELNQTDIVVASSISKIIASVAWYPHEVIRTRLQNQTQYPPKYKGLINTTRLIILEEGIAALYKGMGTNLLRVTPAGAITFTAYESILSLVAQWDREWLQSQELT
eukprot:Colp12_sorted_trinity150504_noHs@13727